MHDPALLDFIAKIVAAMCASVPLTIVAIRGLKQSQANGVKASEIHILVNSQKQELERALKVATDRIVALEDLLEGQFARFRAMEDHGP